jgi:hypothetical protein
MLGLTSYQEALRAVGRLADPTSELQLIEHAEQGWLELITCRGTRQIGAAELEDIVIASLAQRGVRTTSGETSDVLRSVGLALDEPERALRRRGGRRAARASSACPAGARIRTALLRGRAQ